LTAFVDTSALYALLDRDDEHHEAAAALFPVLLESDELVTHSYVVVESAALVQRRLGSAALRALFEDLLPAITVVFVDESTHRAASSALLAAVRRRVSFVDWVSFELMRRESLEVVFAFDHDFRAQGFVVRP